MAKIQQLFVGCPFRAPIRRNYEYKSYPVLKRQLTARYLSRLPFMRRWRDFQKIYSSYVAPAIDVFEEIRTSGRTVRQRLVAVLDGTGITCDDLLEALSSLKLVTVKRGRAGGVFFPPR